MAAPVELGDIQLVDYICETCRQLNQFTPQSTIQCRFCGEHIFSKPRTTDPKPIKMFGCDYRKTLEDLELEELQAILNQPIKQRLVTSLVRLQKYKEAFVADLLQQLISVSPKKKSESKLRTFINNIFSSWHLTALTRGQLNVNLFPTDSIVIQDDLIRKLKEPELPKIVSAVHVNFPSFDDPEAASDLILLDFKATRTVNVQGKKTIVSGEQADRLVKMYSGNDNEFDLHIYYLYNLYSILGTKLCSIPSAAAASGLIDKPIMDLLSTPLTGISDRFNSILGMDKEVWGSEGLSFEYKIRGGESAPVYVLFTLDRNLSNQVPEYLAGQYGRHISNVDIIVILPKKEESPFAAIEVIKKSIFYKKSKSIDSQTHRLVDPDQKFCKPNKDDLVMLHLANYESELKLGNFSKQWKKASE